MTGVVSITIYHDPADAASRNVLAMLQAAGYLATVVDYQSVGWTRPELQGLLARMGVRPRDVLRTEGTPAAELGLIGPEASDAQILLAMTVHPVLVKAPIVVTPRGARLCRPSDLVLQLIARRPAAFAKEDETA
jgi:arsenate reductase (glutaredoxin)